jgi:Cdc6-like AAA superfamily ATPase
MRELGEKDISYIYLVNQSRMKRIIILKGTADTGKTTIINMVVQWILSTYQVANTVGFDPANLQADTSGVLTINKLRVGINSAGDDEANVLRIDTLAQAQCDIILCSCRTKGITYQHIYKTYNYSAGYLQTLIYTEPVAHVLVAPTNLAKAGEVKDWIIGLEKP